jgi:hypothetical protein
MVGIALDEPHAPTPRRIAQVRRRLVQVRRRLVQVRQEADSIYLETGMLLRKVNQNGYWRGWGFQSFEAYAQSELRLRRRKAFYLISVAEAFHRLAITPAERAGISLSKAVEIAAATRTQGGQPRKITPAQRKALLAQARTLTTRALRNALREERGV